MFSTRECNFIIQMLLLFCKKKIVYLIHFPRQQHNRKIIYSQPENTAICHSLKTNLCVHTNVSFHAQIGKCKHIFVRNKNINGRKPKTSRSWKSFSINTQCIHIAIIGHVLKAKVESRLWLCKIDSWPKIYIFSNLPYIES